jgi:hypothetical protein
MAIRLTADCIKICLPLVSCQSQDEELDFAGFIEPDDETDVTLTIDGFLLWINLSPGL